MAAQVRSFDFKKEEDRRCACITKKFNRVVVFGILCSFLANVNVGEASFSLPTKTFSTTRPSGIFDSSNNEGGRCSASKSALSMYLQPNAPMSSKNMITDNRPANTWQYGLSDSSRSGTASAIASSDVLPQFRPAHGLLHPHTIMRLEEASSSSKIKNSPAVKYFLDTYREYGPMACLPILSDPDVLPELTNAMRRIATY